MDVSHSKVKTFRRCKRAYHNKYILKLRKRIKSHALSVGSIVHELIELWSLGKSYKKALIAHRKEESKMFESEMPEEGSAVDLAEAMVKNYTDNYDVEDIVVVEQHLRVPLIDGIDFIGYVDGIINQDGAQWLKEIKTCKSFPDENLRMSDIQTVLYRWALPQMGFKIPRGVIWDYLRKKLPVVPELLKKGGLSQNKKMDTTYELYLEAIHDNDLDSDDYTEMLERLKNKENNFQRRIVLPFSKTMETEVMRDFRETAIEIRDIGHLVKARNLTRDCSWCDYNNLCQAQLKNLDVDYIIKKEFTTKEQRDAQEKRNKAKVIKSSSKNKKGS